MPLHRLQQLARTAGYAPDREMRNSAEPAMVSPGVKELTIRFEPATRTFAAVADDGLVVAIELMAPGGDERAVETRLRAALHSHYSTRGLRIA